MIVIIIMKKNGEGKVSAFQVPKDKFTKCEEECKKLLNVKSKTQARSVVPQNHLGSFPKMQFSGVRVYNSSIP